MGWLNRNYVAYRSHSYVSPTTEVKIIARKTASKRSSLRVFRPGIAKRTSVLIDVIREGNPVLISFSLQVGREEFRGTTVMWIIAPSALKTSVDSTVKPHARKSVRDAILRQPPEAKKGRPIRTTRRSLFRAARSHFFSAEEHVARALPRPPRTRTPPDAFILNFPGPARPFLERCRPIRAGQCIMRERPVFGMRGRGGSSRKVSERMAFYLKGKTPLNANDLSLKEATA